MREEGITDLGTRVQCGRRVYLPITQIVCHKCKLDSSYGPIVRVSKQKWAHIECPRDYQDFQSKMRGVDDAAESDEDN